MHSSQTNPFLITLVQAGLLTQEQAAFTCKSSQEIKQSLISTLIEYQKLDTAVLANQLATHLNLPFFDLSQTSLDTLIQNVLDATFIREYHILPLKQKNKKLYIGISDPDQLDCIPEIKFHTDLTPFPVVVCWDKQNRLIQNLLNESAYLFSSHNDVVSWGDQLLQDAILKQASDVHIEPSKTGYRIRFRIDGILQKMTQLTIEAGNRLTARFKVMGRLDMAERRKPQDGRFTFEGGQQLRDCRLSICPTLFGEKIVIRILDANKLSLDSHQLGFEPEQHAVFLNALKKTQGMILVTGPTGSGKTATLYTALNLLNTMEKNICTVEDPIEITLSGVNQTAIDSKIEMSFATALRALLRQDPDIIMVGEIRDQETAETAIKAAQTGHLVLATLHTNSAAEAISRLSTLGLSQFNIAHTIHLIIAQRLIRKLCRLCKKPIQEGYTATGCDECHQGYKGRTAIFECFPILPEMIPLIMQDSPLAELKCAAKKAGMMDIRQAALNKRLNGISSLEEIERVIF